MGLPFGSKVEYASELLSQIPVPGTMIRAPNELPNVCVAETTLPYWSATTKCVV